MNEIIKWYQITEIVPYRNFNFQYHDGDTIAKTSSLNSFNLRLTIWIFLHKGVLNI